MTIEGAVAIIRHRWLVLALTFLLGSGVGGVFAHYWPPSYTASGLLFVSSPAQPVKDKFSYEGFYSQQVADRYAQTIAGLLESEQLISQALVSYGHITPLSVKDLSSRIKVTRPGSQLVKLLVRSSSPDDARQWWKVLSGQVIVTSERLRESTNSPARVVSIWDETVVEEKRIAGWVGAASGGLLVIIGWVFYLSLKVRLTESLSPAKDRTR